MEVHNHPYAGKEKITAMAERTGQRIIKLIIYVIIGFAAAFVWHQMKNN